MTYCSALVGFGRFRRLESLMIWLDFGFDFEPEEEAVVCTALTHMANECPQLKRFALHLYDTAFDGLNCLAIAGQLRQLTALDIQIGIVGGNVGSIRDLRPLSRLKYLKLDLNYLTDHHFNDIGLYLPSLVSLDIKNAKAISDQTLEQISALKHLKSLSLWWSNSEDKSTVSADGIDRLIERSTHLHYLNLFNTNGVDISSSSMVKFKTKAIRAPKMQFTLKVKFKSNEQDHLLSSVIPIPSNMRLKSY